MQRDYQAIVAAPFGALGIRLVAGVPAAIDFLPAMPATPPAGDPAVRAVYMSLQAYLHDPRTPLPLSSFPHGTSFQQRVWQALRAIPVGTTVTYAELARRVGSGARAVANACGANPLPLLIPCHRVVSSHGLGGFMRGRTTDALAIKHWLLEHERGRSGAA